MTLIIGDFKASLFFSVRIMMEMIILPSLASAGIS